MSQARRVREPIDPVGRSKPDQEGAARAASSHPAAPPEGEAGARPLEPGLYIVATPIGNLEDVSLRALAVLRHADLVACEDTRVSAKLFARFGIATRRVPYHEHNAERIGPELLARIEAGAAVALISDAGTPLVSDPGFRLVRAAVARGLGVTAVPGASAPLAALVLSGLPCDRFLFAGFLPPRTAARRRTLAELGAVPATLVFLESAPRLRAALEDMSEMLGPRPAAVARELTKLYEEVRRDTLPVLAEAYRRDGPPKGEIVVVVGPPEAEAPADDAALDAALAEALRTMSVREGAAAVAAALGLPRREVYQRALALAGKARR